MDLAGMTVIEKLDILYADASWLNDDGTTKSNYQELQYGKITNFLTDYEEMIKDLLTRHTHQELADAIKIKVGTFANWVSNSRNDDKPKAKPDGMKRRYRRTPTHDTENNIINNKKKVLIEMSFIARLEEEQTNIKKDIREIEQAQYKLPTMKKILESIGHLISELKELENPIDECNLDGVINNAITNVVEDVPVFDGGSATFKHSEQSAE